MAAIAKNIFVYPTGSLFILLITTFTEEKNDSKNKLTLFADSVKKDVQYFPKCSGIDRVSATLFVEKWFTLETAMIFLLTTF